MGCSLGKGKYKVEKEPAYGEKDDKGKNGEIYKTNAGLQNSVAGNGSPGKRLDTSNIPFIDSDDKVDEEEEQGSLLVDDEVLEKSKSSPEETERKLEDLIIEEKANEAHAEPNNVTAEVHNEKLVKVTTKTVESSGGDGTVTKTVVTTTSTDYKGTELEQEVARQIVEKSLQEAINTLKQDAKAQGM